MTELTPLFPRQKVPSLALPEVGGGTWKLSDQSPESFTMIVFYRGLHCPICSRYLGNLNAKAGDFASKGVGIVVASSDTEERAGAAKSEWGLDKLNVAYGLDLDAAREWGLYISSGTGKTSTGHEEPALFNEPGLFLVRPDGTLYFGTTQTMPFARPSFADILGAVGFVLDRNYPARGEIVDHHAGGAKAAE